ncbi:hypothetical protein BCR36DRAFT_401483 [Piromyces finnis]|uniref:Cyclin N-terminal domain-containing protein n=1 Tax=Piromyces finnis TaxID=1754191 RepID=A0A1Y1VLS8_9FUNG|nr:hypothetical protein BCR36DRAFT_401483 [Piromyces finnis]|eukprot:ORX59887.1 hypothetical protein BCR36DRAFT_401483 [Piromyces finnis]
MGRKGGKKYRREIRKEQSERDKDALFWKLGKQLSDPLGEYRQFIANIRNKEFNEVDDYVDIPINLVDLTANLITSLITGENCLYESINESDKRLDHSNEKDKYSDEDEEIIDTEAENKKKNLYSGDKNNNDDKEIKFTKIKPNSNSSTFKKSKSYSFNFEEYCQHENEESFYFIRKIIKKTQLSLTTFIVSLFFIYSYKHMEKDKRRYREHKVSKYITNWSETTFKKSKKKHRKRKNKHKYNTRIKNDSIINEKELLSSQEIKSDDNENKITSPILKTEFLSSFQPRNSIISKEEYSNNDLNTILTQYPSPTHLNYNTDKENIEKKRDSISIKNQNPSNQDQEIQNKSNDDSEKNEYEKSSDSNDNEDEYEDNSGSDSDSNSDDDNEYEKSNLYRQRMHKRHNSRFNSFIKNENFSKNFSYLSSCFILSDRYGSYVIPTFLASIIVADKLLYDATYTNSNWSDFTEGRYTLEDINELERRFLSIMNFQLFISQKKFDEFLSYLDFILCLQKIRAWGSIPFALSYSDIYTLTKKIDSKYFDAYPNNKNNTYEILKNVFKLILCILCIYIILLFLYIFQKHHN